MGLGRVYSLNDVILFGKHKGETLKNIIDTDIEYINYLIEDQDIELDNKCFQYFQEMG
jgi:hypothetical protein